MTTDSRFSLEDDQGRSVKMEIALDRLWLLAIVNVYDGGQWNHIHLDSGSCRRAARVLGELADEIDRRTRIK